MFTWKSSAKKKPAMTNKEWIKEVNRLEDAAGSVLAVPPEMLAMIVCIRRAHKKSGSDERRPMPKGKQRPAKSILDGVDKIIDRSLGLTRIGARRIGKAPHYRHKESCQMLSGSPPPNFDMKALINDIYDRVQSKRKRLPSKENWRFEKQTRIGSKNKSLEVKLERAIVRIPKETWPDADNWGNQIPTASGLMNKSSDKRRALDLVRGRKDGSCEFIELKVNSDNPLYAAMEILTYSALYMFSRKNRGKLGYNKSQNPLLWATNTQANIQADNPADIHLKVLAPCDYYKGYRLDWLENEINSGLKRFLAGPAFDFLMDFKFEKFPSSFRLKPFPHPFPQEYAIEQALKDRAPVYP